MIATQLTDAKGGYDFGVPPGTYVVCETVPVGSTQTYPKAGMTPPPGEKIVACGSGGLGYQVTLAAGKNRTGNDFGSGPPKPFCEKLPVKQVLDPIKGQYPGNKGPDVVVRVDLGKSIQAAIDGATDVNGDGYIIIGVSAHSDGSYGGSSWQSLVFSQTFDKPFALIGCSVTLHDPNRKDGKPTIAIAATASSPPIAIPEGAAPTANLFVMDLHAADSDIAGIKVEGDGRYLRNETATNNAVGIKVLGNLNTLHNGAASANAGNGVYSSGNANFLTDTSAMSNGGNGFAIFWRQWSTHEAQCRRQESREWWRWKYTSPATATCSARSVPMPTAVTASMSPGMRTAWLRTSPATSTAATD